MSTRQKIFGFNGKDWDAKDDDASQLVAMYEDFKVAGEPDLPTLDQIIIAEYTYESYEGSVFVLFERDGQLYEVNGSHCSCNGIEGQWSPEATTWEALYMRRFSQQTAVSAFFASRTVDGQVVTRVVRALPSGDEEDEEDLLHPAMAPTDWGDEDY
jgi:hypothetical protein